MAHLVLIEDAYGEMLDAEVYCSDFCAQTSADYRGWHGCNEIGVSQPCEHCGEWVEGLDEAFEEDVA